MTPIKTAAAGILVAAALVAGVAFTDGQTKDPGNTATTTAKTISEQLDGKTDAEKKAIKSDAIVDALKPSTFIKASTTIELTAIEKSPDGVTAYVRAFKDGKQLGFGDGTIDIERINIHNPPVLVLDPTGPIIRTATTPEGEVKTFQYREDPAEAMRIVIEQVAGAHGKASTIIEMDKVGRTVDVIYPTFDGYVIDFASQTVWGTSHDLTTGTAVDNTATVIYARADKTGSSNTRFLLYRSHLQFATGIIGTNTITEAYLFITPSDARCTPGDSVHVSASTPPNNTLTTADFDALTVHGATSFGSRLITNMSNGSTSPINFNASGLAGINKTGTTSLVTRMGNDINDSVAHGLAPITTACILEYFSVNETGSASDPYLSITHAAAGGGGAAAVDSTTFQILE